MIDQKISGGLKTAGSLTITAGTKRYREFMISSNAPSDSDFHIEVHPIYGVR